MNLVSSSLLLCIFVLTTGGQEVKTQPETCNVVCNCGLGDSKVKGETCSTGPSGQSGENVDEAAITNRILGMQSVTSCGELESEYGVNRNGYYLMRSSTNTPIYNYCDFRVYTVPNCQQLSLRQDVTNGGYYKFGSTSTERSKFRFCQPVFRDVFTCNKLHSMYGIADSGFYKFASGNQPGFKVFCNFTSGEAVTEIWHDSMNEVAIPDCEEDGCYGRIPIYSISAQHIAKVVANSINCRQFIKSRCQGVLMAWNGAPRTWWVSSAGKQMRYWGGATSRRTGYCACGETDTCVVKSQKCNCDNNSETLLTQDEGYLTDKSTLPVKEMRFSDMGGVNELAWHTLGALECTGQV